MRNNATMLPTRALADLRSLRDDLVTGTLGLAALPEAIAAEAAHVASDPGAPQDAYYLAELAEEVAERSLDRIIRLHDRAEALLDAAEQVAQDGRGTEAEGRLLARLLVLFRKARQYQGTAYERAHDAGRAAYLLNPALDRLAVEGL